MTTTIAQIQKTSGMIPYISPVSGRPLSCNEKYWQTDDGSERYEIINGIVRFVPSDNYAEAFGLQWNTYKKIQLDSYTGKNYSAERLQRCLGFPLENLRGLTVLEAGCGPGRFTELLVKYGALTHSFDLSHAVDANMENIGRRENYQIAQADIYAIPYPDEAFDVVCCLGVIQHTPDPEKTIASLWKKVKPGGWLVIDHYRWRWAYYSTLKPLYRFVLVRLKPALAKRIIDALVDFFFPIQWHVRRWRALHQFINRFSPLIVHYYDFPGHTRELYHEWAKMDTMDSTTDRYKHLRTKEQIRHTLAQLGGSEIWVQEGGNGIEARAKKPITSVLYQHQ
ncbi:MAG: class I SAM-dependent methyltransferase [Chitinophagales bacterium]|nr:class I SAM-dependent methyltransferase [Chitinophagales bacterium]